MLLHLLGFVFLLREPAFVLHPPWLNDCVERAQRTDTEGFHELTDSSCDRAELNGALRTWEHVYDTIRPHESPGYLSPCQCLQQHHHSREDERR